MSYEIAGDGEILLRQATAEVIPNSRQLLEMTFRGKMLDLLRRQRELKFEAAVIREAQANDIFGVYRPSITIDSEKVAKPLFASSWKSNGELVFIEARTLAKVDRRFVINGRELMQMPLNYTWLGDMPEPDAVARLHSKGELRDEYRITGVLATRYMFVPPDPDPAVIRKGAREALQTRWLELHKKGGLKPIKMQELNYILGVTDTW